MTRITRIAHTLARLAVQYDPVTRERVRFHERVKLLLKYKGQKDVFGSFTNTFKLGVNPKPVDEATPMGIYAYPVDFIIESYHPEYEMFRVPYARDRSNLYVFRVSNLDRVLYLDSGQRTVLNQYEDEKSDAREEVREITSCFLKAAEMIEEGIENDGLVPERYRVIYGKMAPDLADEFKSWYDNVWYPRFLEKTKLDSLEPELVHRIVEDELFSAESIGWYWTRRYKFNYDDVMSRASKYVKKPNLVDSEFPLEQEIRQLPQAKKLSDEEYKRFKLYVVTGYNSQLRSDNAFVYKMTNRIAGSNIRVWTGLLRKLGLIGVIDQGTSTIAGEPFQGVFFDPGSIKVLEVIQNRPPYKDINQRELARWTRESTEGVIEAVNYINHIIHILQDTFREKNQSMDLTRVLKTVRWLNSQAKDSQYWTPEKKREMAMKLKEMDDNYPLWNSAFQKSVDQVIRLLQENSI